MITLEKVTKTYRADNRSVTIGPVDLEIPAGGVTAFVGPNGAGKSTLLTMVGRLQQMDAGRITVGGHDVAATRSKELAKVVSILRQDNHLVARLTVRQLVGFGRFPYSGGRLTAVDEEIIDKYLDFLDLTALGSRFLDELSGGQRQRAFVAMVLSQQTDYVLLDEPLNNLDIAHSVEMMKHLCTAAREEGRTIVIVVHDINIAARYADYVCAMQDGQVVHVGTVAETMRNDLLSEIFRTPIEVVEGPHGPLASFY